MPTIKSTFLLVPHSPQKRNGKALNLGNKIVFSYYRDTSQLHFAQTSIDPFVLRRILFRRAVLIRSSLAVDTTDDDEQNERYNIQAFNTAQ